MNLTKTVYFVRHGQSESNIKPVYQGLHARLSEDGERQAKQIADRISKIEFDALISSPLERAKQTSEYISEATGKVPEFSSLFVERKKPSRINDKSYDDKEATDIWRKWEASMHTPGMKVDDGENLDDLMARADEALDYLKNRDESNLVVVTHGNFLRSIILRVLLGEAITSDAVSNFRASLMSVENTSISVLKYKDDFEEDPSWRVWIYNDHTHLG